MTSKQNPFERAIMHVMRDMTSEQLAKRVPDIPAMDYRRLAYKAAGIKRTLDNVLTEFGITKKAYYSWYEKYHFFYKQCKNS